MVHKRTFHIALLLALVLGTVAIGLTRTGSVAGQDDLDTQAKIDNAMSAAPASISADATVVDWAMDDAGKFVVLREGTSAWTCFADDPATPSDDPMCLDQTWLDWMYALITGATPPTKVAGFAYMLQGGSDASNTVPGLSEPPAGEEWVISPPHVMILLPGPIDPAGYSTDHNSGGPYVMWAGTPYEHIMMPVADGEHEM